MMNPKPTPKIDILSLEEIPMLIECVRRCYGDSYPNPAMYDPSQLKEIIESQLMHSVVAKLGDDRIIGHCALTFDGIKNSAPEAGKMLVDPDFRGRHLAELMAKKRIDIARQLELAGFWTECVTNHPYSQHEMISFNAKETGLFIGDMPSTISMQGLDNFAETRMSLLTFYLSLADHPHTIFLPLEHVAHVKDLAQDLNLERVIASSDLGGIGVTIVRMVVNSGIQTANISIEYIGDDLVTAVTKELKKIESLNLASIYLDLPIEQEAASKAYLDLEAIGFFWGSWLPNYSAHKDILRLQKIAQKVDPEKIICARNKGEEVKQYVLSEWARITMNQ